MQLALRRTAIAASLFFNQYPLAWAEMPTSVRNDVYNTVLCGGFNQLFTQVDVSCPSWIGSIDISNKAGILINRHHNITCTNLSAALPSIDRSSLLRIKQYVDLTNQNERIASSAFKQCNASLASKAHFNELTAYDEIDKIIAGILGKNKENEVTPDNRDALIESSPYSEKVKMVAKILNFATDPDSDNDIRAWFSDISIDPAYTIVYTASQAAVAPVYQILDAKDFANKMTFGYNG